MSKILLEIKIIDIITVYRIVREFGNTMSNLDGQKRDKNVFVLEKYFNVKFVIGGTAL